MKDLIDILDVVALTEDLPERGLYRGQVGTVVETLAPNIFEIEFSDNEGRTYASLALNVSQLLVLHDLLLSLATRQGGLQQFFAKTHSVVETGNTLFEIQKAKYAETFWRGIGVV